MSTRNLVAGAGTLGTSLMHSLLEGGGDVTGWDEDKRVLLQLKKSGQCDRHPNFPQKDLYKKLHVKRSERINCRGFDYVVLAPSMEGLVPVLGLLDNITPSNTLVVVQKGMAEWGPGLSPYDLVRSRYDKRIPTFSFTGAGYGQHILEGQLVRMLAACDPNDGKSVESAKRFNEQLAKTNIKTGLSFCPELMSKGGLARTVYTIITIIVRYHLRNQPGTLASALGGIEREYWEVVERLCRDMYPVLATSDEFCVLQADIDLNNLIPSIDDDDPPGRNTRLALLLAKGMFPAEAYRKVHSKYGAVEGYLNTPLVYDRVIGHPADDYNPDHAGSEIEYPYLFALYWLLCGFWTLERCVEYIYSLQ